MNSKTIDVLNTGYSACIVSNKVKVGDTITFTINNYEPWMSVGLMTLEGPFGGYYIGENSKGYSILSDGKTFYKLGHKVKELKGKEWGKNHKI